MERFVYGFATFFALALGMFFEGGSRTGETSSVTHYGKATLETDG